MNLQHLHQAPPGKIRALFGLTPTALAELLGAVLPVLRDRRRQAQASRPHRQRAVGGGRKRRLKPYQEVLLTLIYLRHNVSPAVVGELFGVSADTSENTFHEVVSVLREVCPSERWDAEKRWKRSEPIWQPDEVDRVLLDSFETPVRRPSLPDRQKRISSGKKKRHTLKTQLVTDEQGEILSVAAGARGPTADLRLSEESQGAQQYPKAEKGADLAYQSQAHPEIRVPQKNPKGGALTPEQRQANRQVAQVRVPVEHAIRRIKGWRIVREAYRLALGLFPLIAGAVIGLVQLVRIAG